MYFMSINKIKPDADRAMANRTIFVHREWAKQQFSSGVLVQAGKWGGRGGVIIIRAETREDADRIVNDDPLQKAGLITYETAELHAAVPFQLPHMRSCRDLPASDCSCSPFPHSFDSPSCSWQLKKDPGTYIQCPDPFAL